MLYLVGGEFQKKPGSMKNFERRSNLLDIAFFDQWSWYIAKIIIGQSFNVTRYSGWEKNLRL